MNRDNLKKLADYLLALPDDYHDFDMGVFCKIPGTEREFGPSETVHQCGTVGCALGHGPVAGIRPGPTDLDWRDYCLNQFELHWWSDEAEWCFGGEWSLIDDTPQGAGKRILWLLDGHPIPTEAELANGDAAEILRKFNYQVA